MSKPFDMELFLSGVLTGSRESASTYPSSQDYSGSNPWSLATGQSMEVAEKAPCMVF